jgi:Trk K+ transport system NAD-binding subunit
MLASRLVTWIESITNRTGKRPSVAVVGGSSVGSALATKFQNDGADVRFLDDTERAVRKASSRSIDAYHGDPTNSTALARVDPESVDVAVVLDPSDRRTALSAQLLRTGYDCEVVALVSDPDNFDVIESMDFRVISRSEPLAGELDAVLENPSDDREG